MNGAPTSGPVRILGIDPGSVTTGWGVIESDGRHSTYIAHGCVQTGGGSMPSRLGVIFRAVAELLAAHTPDEMAIEDVFLNRNARAALKLGQARGAAICAGMESGIPVAEYEPRLVKQAIVGTGGADKVQVQHMVGVLLNIQKMALPADAADALAIALCHAHARSRPVPTAPAGRRRSVRWT